MWRRGILLLIASTFLPTAFSHAQDATRFDLVCTFKWLENAYSPLVGKVEVRRYSLDLARRLYSEHGVDGGNMVSKIAAVSAAEITIDNDVISHRPATADGSTKSYNRMSMNRHTLQFTWRWATERGSVMGHANGRCEYGAFTAVPARK